MATTPAFSLSLIVSEEPSRVLTARLAPSMRSIVPRTRRGASCAKDGPRLSRVKKTRAAPEPPARSRFMCLPFLDHDRFRLVSCRNQRGRYPAPSLYRAGSKIRPKHVSARKEFDLSGGTCSRFAQRFVANACQLSRQPPQALSRSKVQSSGWNLCH